MLILSLQSSNVSLKDADFTGVDLKDSFDLSCSLLHCYIMRIGILIGDKRSMTRKIKLSSSQLEIV